ncbi:hypothetical protein GGR57DRAFT_369964 [Xylariaceae sp. FL1272]|nr:hypothetical protein GGR57DRAFT_369964 [Xylariaceae sp. FL1272]
MADVAEAIAAALAAAGVPPAPPLSPDIKTEPVNSDAMMIDSEPPPPTTQFPPSPPQQKRSRSPDNARINGDDQREEKRLKVESSPWDDDLDEIARMVQAASENAMRTFQSPLELETEPESPPASQPQPQPQPQVAYMPDEYKPEPVPEHDAEAPTHGLDITEHVESSIENPLDGMFDEADSPPKDSDESRPDTLWSNHRDYTRRKHVIPALGALAVDILIALSEQTLEDTLQKLCDQKTDIAEEYEVLRKFFDYHRRQLLKGQDGFLNADELGCQDETREVIRIANLAAACSTIFSANEITLEEVNNHFLEIFLPEGGELTYDTAELYLGLKTQLFLAVLEGDMEKSKEEFLQELFVTGVEESLRAQHPDTPLNTTETDFLANTKTRKLMLLSASQPADSIQVLSKQFTYEAFLDNLSTYLNDNIENIQAEGSSKSEAKITTSSPAPADDIHDSLDDFDLNAMIAEASKSAAESAMHPINNDLNNFDDLSAFLSMAVEQSRQMASSSELPVSIASATESASRATALALESMAKNQWHPAGSSQTTSQIQSSVQQNGYNSQRPPTQQVQFPYQRQPQPSASTNAHGPQQTAGNALPPNQTDSTPALYERARQAAAARSSTHARREGSHSTRRPWSPEEEKALMMGLDMVKGPHWSQILSLFGPAGTMSRILADRTQVQLKDKARNLKLFFLKTNSEMPYYLQCVTGELKTRAPTQAARKEAEEKARLNSEEHQAHMNGILTLAGGLQNNSAPRPNPSVTAPRSSLSQQNSATSHSHQSTPMTSQQSSQPLVSTPAPPRPAIPAPQPVSLPTFTSINRNTQNQPAPTPMPSAPASASAPVAPPPPPPPPQQPTPTPKPPAPHPLYKVQEHLEELSRQTTPVSENTPATQFPVDNSDMSSIDAAVLGLKAAIAREPLASPVAVSSASATPVAPATTALPPPVGIKQESIKQEQDTHINGTKSH